MKTTVKATNESIAAALATPDAHVWIDGNTVHVFTGEDIPPPPPPAVEYVEKSVAIAALKAAGKTDAEAKALLSAEVGKG